MEDLRARVDAVRRRVKGRDRPRVLVLEWPDPPFNAGHWVPDQVEAAGGVPVLAEAGARSRRLTWEEIEAEQVDVTVFMPCGFDLDGAVAQAPALLARPEIRRSRPHHRRRRQRVLLTSRAHGWSKAWSCSRNSFTTRRIGSMSVRRWCAPDRAVEGRELTGREVAEEGLQVKRPSPQCPPAPPRPARRRSRSRCAGCTRSVRPAPRASSAMR